MPPERRGRGLSAPGMAAVVRYALRRIAPLVSLYVNDYNRAARRDLPHGWASPRSARSCPSCSEGSPGGRRPAGRALSGADGSHRLAVRDRHMPHPEIDTPYPRTDSSSAP